MSDNNGVAEDLARIMREFEEQEAARPLAEEYKPNLNLLRMPKPEINGEGDSEDEDHGDAWEPPQDGTDQAPSAPPKDRSPPKDRFKFIDSGELASGDYRPDWLVKGVLVKSQPALIAGPSKGLKTNVSIDLALSLATGSPFLGEFAVPKPEYVGVVSGESGAATIQETARRVCDAKGLKLGDLGERVRWCFGTPTFTDLAGMDEIAADLALFGAKLVLLDPLYLMLGNVDAKNLFEMGGSLRVVSEVFARYGITPVLIHHANKQLPVGEPMELAHIAYSGLEQYARQFLLVNRRTKYLDDGNHDLWLRCGGSAGHGGLWNLRVEEGITDEHFGGRKWNVKLLDIGAVKNDVAAQKEAAKRQSADEKSAADQKAVMDAIDDEVNDGKPGATQTRIRQRTSFGQPKCKDVLALLMEFGQVEEREETLTTGNGTKMKAVVYRRPQAQPEADLLTGTEEEKPARKPKKRAVNK